MADVPVFGVIKKGEYFDSVTLMLVAKKIGETEGVVDSAVVMGTLENKSILEASGLMTAEFEKARDTDLLIAVKTGGKEIAEDVFQKVDIYLKDVRKSDRSALEFSPKSVESALKLMPDANMALISLAGKYAGDEAMKSLRKGLHVMLFSDNVPLEKEIELKKYARNNGLIVMGPDCGTAIINGIPLAFANAVNRGDIGVVAAAGTGLQEVTSIISNEGAGISQAIGTGGRDMKKEVGGMMFIEGMNALARDGSTNVILLVSKPPHPDVLKKLLGHIKKVRKPVVAVFLGGDNDLLERDGIHTASTLEEAALRAVAISKYEARYENLNDVSGEMKIAMLMREASRYMQGLESVAERLKTSRSKIAHRAFDESKKMKTGQKYLRGLFSGGTFASEAQLIFKELAGEVYSNIPLKPKLKLKNPLKSERNTVIDLGEDEFTVGRAHPMIDYSLRNKRIMEEALDPEVAVILLDLVIGYGSNMKPLEDIVPAIRQAMQTAAGDGRRLAVITSVTGTDKDPQNRAAVIKGLEEAGAMVMTTNAAAAQFAGHIVKILGGGRLGGGK